MVIWQRRTMNAAPILRRVARALRESRLEAVMIGNAAAALQGAPVTTVDVDFLFRKTPSNLRKLKMVARALGAIILRPYYPVSDLFRLSADDDSLQLDFMATIHGVRSYTGLRSRACYVDLNGERLLVAALSDIIASKRAANRPRDKAVIDVLSATLAQRKADASRKTGGPEAGK
jgi:predicted nucleotidyltransferase